MAVDMDKFNAFMGLFVADLGAAVHTGMVVIGERLGLYKALAERPMTSAELALKTKTDERYVRECCPLAINVNFFDLDFYGAKKLEMSRINCVMPDA